MYCRTDSVLQSIEINKDELVSRNQSLHSRQCLLEPPFLTLYISNWIEIRSLERCFFGRKEQKDQMTEMNPCRRREFEYSTDDKESRRVGVSYFFFPSSNLNKGFRGDCFMAWDPPNLLSLTRECQDLQPSDCSSVPVPVRKRLPGCPLRKGRGRSKTSRSLGTTRSRTSTLRG